ncbi:guanylate-binding protein 5-like [Tenrec ecaudatus]|uniref:guanylate-binding protein 5-like n=1 Tax=Tenrec ecaudatus TaxID=94439 RepID=UPI003F5A603A
MAPGVHMPDPVCLIENIDEQLVVNQDALEILSAIQQPLVVVAIVGLYRTGKSYLMNKLAGTNQGFSVGSTVQSHTKGIWMWCVSPREAPDHTFVLLDTEGLGDVEKVDEAHDYKIFALALLLSSTFVYNTKYQIDQHAVDLLHNVTEVTNLLLARCSSDLAEGEDAANLESFFPELVWIVRDFYLQLEADGQLLTADEYLENSLRPKQDTGGGAHKFNLPRLCIQKFFPKKKCFLFDLPSHRELSQLKTLPDQELEPEFVQTVSEFCSYIFNHSKLKTLPGDIKVNGPCLESLVLTYVNAINSGNLPCMENSVLALAQIENTAAVQKAIAHYDEQMGQKAQLPTETLQELLDLHRAVEREAIAVFMKSSFKDVDQKFQKELETQLEAKQEGFCQQNLQASSERCAALLREIFGPLEEEVNQGVYSKPGGHCRYIQKIESLKNTYYQKPQKGIQAEETLQKYLMSKESVSDTILQSDLMLTAKEKELEEARVKAAAAQAEARRQEEIQRQHQLRMEEMERNHQNQLRQMEQDRINRLAQQQREQEQEQQRRMQEEAQRIRQMLEAQTARSHKGIRRFRKYTKYFK